ncbi:MAG: pyridoxamine 5'-phosphate oxidase family protein [Desulfobacterales bacterium]|nr:pyridoxamine 5'-phosphate oxidase family protein [Desulfobacterales bacterium]MDX2512820.1 pyridoxamine 5'-phosphate oxidase family protein [Desulfobacterales bacterium]
MTILPEAAAEAWENREGPVVMTTVDSSGIPNTIYITCVNKYSKDQIVVADNKMHKTRANVKAGSPASLLYITKDKKAFQLKGSVAYVTEGTLFDDMKNGWLDKKYPGHAAVVITIEEVYSGAKKLA